MSFFVKNFCLVALTLTLVSCKSTRNSSYSAPSATRPASDSGTPDSAAASKEKNDKYEASLKDLNNQVAKSSDRLIRYFESLKTAAGGTEDAYIASIDAEITVSLRAISVLETMYSDQYLDIYFSQEFKSDFNYQFKMYAWAYNKRAKLVSGKESLLKVRVAMADGRAAIAAVNGAAAPAVVNVPATTIAESTPTTLTAKTADNELAKIRKANSGSTPADRLRLESDLKVILGKLAPGSIIAYDGDNLPVVVTASTEASYVSKFNLEAVSGFIGIAKGTDGVMGLSDAKTLPKIIDVIFEHIKTNSASGAPIDIAFVLDTTSSMQPYINSVKENLVALVDRLKVWSAAEEIEIRLSLVLYRDSGDDYVTKTELEFTTNYADMQKAIKAAVAVGGGDIPEAALDAIVHAQNKLAWKPRAQRKIILISDAPGHPKTLDGKMTTEDVTRECKARDTAVVIYPVITR